MPRLVLDACASLHLKHWGALDLLAGLRERGCELLAPTGVYGEMVSMSLSDWVLSVGVERTAVTRTENRKVTNHCDPKRMPGSRDRDAVALAVRVGAVLLTHDDACAEVARGLRVTVVDACDVADFHHRMGWSDWPSIEALLSKLASYAWKPGDWSGSVEATVAERPYRARSADRLDAWWNGGSP